MTLIFKLKIVLKQICNMFMGFSYKVLNILILGPSSMRKNMPMGMQMCIFLNMETVLPQDYYF